MTKSFLPNGWHLVKFGDYVRKVNTRVDLENSTISRYVAGEHMDTDNLRITRWGIVGDGYLGPAFTTRFAPGQVLYGSRRTYLRKVALADFEGICANTTFVLEPKSEKLLNDFLPHVMSTGSFHSYSISKSKGSVNPYINFVDLKDYEFMLPPIAEQHRIVSLVSAIDNAISKHEFAVKKCEEAITATSVEFLETSTVDKEKLNKVANIERGVSYKSSDYATPDEGRPFLTLKAVTRDGQFSPSGIKWVRSEFATENSARPGDLFFANTDLTPGRLLVGAPFFFPGIKENEDPCFSMDLSRVRAVDSRVTNEYLYFVLNLPRIRKEMRRLTGGSTVGHLRLREVAEIEVPVLDEATRDHFLTLSRKLVEFQSGHFRHIHLAKELRRNLVERCLGGVSDV